MKLYTDLIKQIDSLFEDETNIFANASNLAALVFEKVPSLNWVGYYFVTNDELVLGPFQGKTACIRIKLGKGVCGTSAVEMKTISVPNVHEFDGHIACDSQSNSEIVVPIIKDGILYGVLDIDSPAFNRFGDEEKKYFEYIVELLVNKSDIEVLKKIY